MQAHMHACTSYMYLGVASAFRLTLAHVSSLDCPSVPGTHSFLGDEGRHIGLDKAAGLCTIWQGTHSSNSNLAHVLSAAAALSCNAP
jgi:hypothetical protein